MRTVLVLAGLLVLSVAHVRADPNDLRDGALIAHTTGPYSRYPNPTCDTYFSQYQITSCEEQVTTMGWGTYVWFVIAAFMEDKQWCGVQFGFSDFDPQLMVFLEHGPCAPGAFIETPSAGWPGPGSGTAFVTAGTPWTGNWQPVYWFAVYAYEPSYGTGVVQLVPDPTASIPFGGFVNCAAPPERFDAALGGMGVGEPGTWVCPTMQDGICCVGDDCIIVHSGYECTALGGQYHPEWDDCGPPNPCAFTQSAGTTWGLIKSMYR